MKPAIGLLLAALTPSQLAQAPAPTAPLIPVQPAPSTDAPAQPPPAPTLVPWLPRPVVALTALDKVSALSTPLRGKIGEELHYGSLTIVARACVAHPPDAVPDAAAFLDITDSRPGIQPFHGWMLLNEPAISIYEHPVYEIRLAGCLAG